MYQLSWQQCKQFFRVKPPVCMTSQCHMKHVVKTLQTDELRNESNIFSVDGGINQKRTENCINACSALLQMFSVLFTVDTLINWKYIRLISYHLIFIAFQETKIQFSPFKCRIFDFWRWRDTYNVTIIFFRLMQFLTNQNKSYTITLLNIKWFSCIHIKKYQIFIQIKHNILLPG